MALENKVFEKISKTLERIADALEQILEIQMKQSDRSGEY